MNIQRRLSIISNRTNKSSSFKQLANTNKQRENKLDITEDRSCQTSLDNLKAFVNEQNIKALVNTNNLRSKKAQFNTIQVDNSTHEFRHNSSQLKSILKNNPQEPASTLELHQGSEGSLDMSQENSFIENEFIFDMKKEDQSIEELKKVFIQNKNLTLTWDFVQSSDFL